MREFSEKELDIIECMMLEAMQGDTMDINEFLKEMEEEERRRVRSRKTIKLKLRNMLGKITNRFVRI